MCIYAGILYYTTNSEHIECSSQTVIFTYCKVNNNKNMITSSLRVYAIARLYDCVNMLFQFRYSSKSQL